MENMIMKIVVLVSLILLPLVSAQASEFKPYEMPRTEVVPIQESGTDRQYELYIKLPEDYAENTDTRYPVIYTTDAVVHMDMLSGATEFLMPEVILVGISYQTNHEDERANISRFRDYTMVESTNPRVQAKFQPGQAGNHLSFIRNEVFSYIENNYRANPAERSYFGYSLGGAFGAYMLLSKPDSFKNYILGSPAFNPPSSEYIDQLEAQIASEQQNLNVNVFLSLGEKEEDAKESVEGLMTVLRRRSETGLALTGLEIIEDSDHATAFPETVIRGVRWLTERSSNPNQYFGQTPPGLIPEIFAPDIVSIDGRIDGTISFSPDFTEMYFSADNGNDRSSIYFSKLEDDKWTPIQEVNFTKGRKNEEFHPFVSPDDNRIYFTAMDSAPRDPKIWYVNRLGSSWTDAIQLDSPINDDPVFFSNQAENGDLYYFNLAKGKTYYAPNRDGKFPEVREVILESGHHAFISPSQDYLVLTARSDEQEGRRDNDIYVYFKEKDGTWAKPIRLGNTINTSLNEKTPTISPDGKYLFFGRDEVDEIEGNVGLANTYWVSTQVIENLRPETQTEK